MSRRLAYDTRGLPKAVFPKVFACDGTTKALVTCDQMRKVDKRDQLEDLVLNGRNTLKLIQVVKNEDQ